MNERECVYLWAVMPLGLITLCVGDCSIVELIGVLGVLFFLGTEKAAIESIVFKSRDLALRVVGRRLCLGDS